VNIGPFLVENGDIAAPASAEAIANLKAAYPQLPREYVSLLQVADGFSGFLGESRAFLSFLLSESIGNANRGYEVESFLPGAILLATNGAGAGFFFTNSPELPWMRAPLIGMDELESQITSPALEAMIKEYVDTLDDYEE